MRFEKDLFISYAHIDNKPLTPEQQGWITRFHASLEALLSMRMGGKALIWRDNKLQGNDIFADEIVAQFSQTALLVSVLTPRYLNSDWCNKEVAEFCKRAEQSGGMVVENKARIFKVLKAPDVPSVLVELGYLSNAKDEAQLLNADWRGKAAQSITNAVALFASAKGGAGTGG